MAKKTLILHAGMGKTGTTAIQETFWKNRAALSRAGIAYPRTGAVAGAHHLITPRIPPFLKGRRGWHFVAPPDWAPAVAALAEPRVFMSSELISAAEPAQIAAFCAALTPFFDLHLCLYLRRQDDMIAAAWAQAVKAGSQTRPLSEVLDTRLGRLDYTTRIAPWEQALDRDRLILLPYERSQFHAGDLIRDVLFRVLGLADLPPGFVHDPAANPNARLSIPATEFKRLVNLLIPDHPRANRFNTPLAACAPDPRGAHLLGRADRARIIAAFADSNARIARDYMNRPEGDLFRDPLPADAPDTALLPDATALAEVAATLGQTAPQLLREITTLAAADHDTPAARAAALRLREALNLAPALAPAAPSRRPRKTPSARDIARGLRDRVLTPAPVPAPTRWTPGRKAGAPTRLVVHYGMHKTGSSSIQETLWNNRTRLGPVQYLDFGRVNGSFAMTDFFRRDGGQTRDIADFDAALAGLQGRTGVISAEVLSVFTPAQLDRFLGALRRVGASAHFIGYVRDPVGYYGSQFQQVLKTRALTFDDPATWRTGGKGTAAYFRWVDMLADRVGAAHVEAHPFRRELFPQGDVVRHFLGRLADLTGLDTGPVAIARGNESLSALAVKALYVWRGTLAPNDDAAPHPTSAGDFITRLRDIPGDRFRFAPAVEARLASLHPGFAAWAKDRLIWPAGTAIAPVPPPRPADTGPVIATEADLRAFTPEDLATLARWAGLPPPGPVPDANRAAQVARMMAVARDQRRPRQTAVTLGRRIVALPRRLSQAIRPVLPSPALLRTARSPAPVAQEMLVHFGIRKTGSSSIQETLFRAPDGALGDTRYLSYGIANSSLMVRNLFVAPDSHSRVVQGVLRTRFDLGVRRIASAPHAILSAETISDLDTAGLEKLTAALSARGAQLSFIGYLRDPVTYLRSAFQEQLKNAYGRGFPFGPGGVPRRNYHQIVDRLDALAGPDRVRVFPFDRALFPQGDVVRHFLDQARIDPDRLTIRRVNESLSMTAVKALFAYRRLRAPRDTDIGSDTTRDVFVALLSRLEGPAFQLSPAIDARIARRNVHILDWSERRLGTRLMVPRRDDDDGIRSEEDMLVFTPEDLARLDALAREAGTPGLPAGLTPATTPEAVADLLHALRLLAAQDKVLPALRGKDAPQVPAGPGRQAAPAVTGKAKKPPSPLLVHFGMHKTGSSSIQHTLLNNKGQLGGQRYLSFGRHNSSFLVNRGFGETQASAAKRQKARETMSAAFKAPAGAGRAILSAEDICHLRPENLAEFHRFLLDNQTDATFIGYLRDPVSFTRSAMQQDLKTKMPGTDPFAREIRASNYHQIVDRLDALAGPDRVRVFPFDAALFPQGDVVRHFLDQAGIDPDRLTIHRVNESLSMTAVKALFAYRHLRAPHDGDIGSEVTRDAFVALLSRLDGPAFRFSPEVDARIASRNTHILDWSERRLGMRLAMPARDDTAGVGSEEDMLRFDEADLARLDALACEARLQGLPAGLTPATAPEAVADLLHALRLLVARRGAAGGTPA